MEQYQVTGMTCAACSARVERAVKAVEGVSACAVNLITGAMAVEGSASAAAVMAAVENAGYGISLREEGAASAGKDTAEDSQTVRLWRRFAVSLAFLLPLMYLTMGHLMWGWPLPMAIADNPMAIGLVQLLLTVILMVVNGRFFTSGFRGLLHGAPNMDTLVALGAGAAFLYSTVQLFSIADRLLEGDIAMAMHGMHGLYFESAAMILTLITLGKTLEARAKGRTTDALRGLMALTPRTATVATAEGETVLPVEQVKMGDVFLVRPGEAVPVDGVVMEGISAVNEAPLTGESVPVDKAAGDTVSAATLNLSGYLRCRATRVGEDTTLARIIRMVEDAAATKAPIAKLADKVSGIFVPVVLGIAAVTLVVWLLLKASVSTALGHAIAVLVISCPCALGLATPVAIMVGNGVGAKHGVLFKTAAALEHTGRTRIVALDKTGTITCGEPQVTDVLTADHVTESVLLQVAFGLEDKSEHPLATAVCHYAREQGLSPVAVENFQVLPGRGLQGEFQGELLVGGNLAFAADGAALPQEMASKGEALAGEGKTPLYFRRGDTFLGLIAVADTVKEDSPAAVKALKRMGIRVVMLTGDNSRTAEAIGRLAGIDEVIAGVLPDEKEAVIRRLQEQGVTAMVGDGINDAPALTRADIGIAIGAGTDIAMDAADVVLMHSRLTDVVGAIRLGRATLRNIRQNLFWAFVYNVIGIPLAAGVFVNTLGWHLNPMFGAAAMSLSSFCVVANALRLNWFRFENKKDWQEESVMEKTFRVDGMMCSHCEAHVQKALEAVEGVTKAVASHQAGTVTVTLTEEVAESALRSAIEAAGYTVE